MASDVPAASTGEAATPSVVPGQRLRLTVAYDGGAFRGWQSQVQGDAVQDHLEKALSAVCQVRRVIVHGSGRTDAGVHALAQVAHADVPDRARHTPERWAGAINARLPDGIRVLEVRFASDAFHARFSTTGKVYRYRLWNSQVLHPFERGRVWHRPGPLDLDLLRRLSQLYLGEHDFFPFSANRGVPSVTTVRTIRRVTVRRQRELLTLEFEGSGFLYKMVRLLTGTLVRCAQGRADPDWIPRLLAGKAGKTSFAAPAEGLFLLRVLYGRKAAARLGSRDRG